MYLCKGISLNSYISSDFIMTSGMYKGTNTEASQALKKLCVHPYNLDVTDDKSVAEFHNYVKIILKNNPNYSKLR